MPQDDNATSAAKAAWEASEQMEAQQVAKAAGVRKMQAWRKKFDMHPLVVSWRKNMQQSMLAAEYDNAATPIASGAEGAVGKAERLAARIVSDAEGAVGKAARIASGAEGAIDKAGVVKSCMKEQQQIMQNAAADNAERAVDKAAEAVESSPWPEYGDFASSRLHSRFAAPLPKRLHLQTKTIEEADRLCRRLAHQLIAKGLEQYATICSKLANRIAETTNSAEDVESTNLAVQAVCNMLSSRSMVTEAQMLKGVWDWGTRAEVLAYMNSNAAEPGELTAELAADLAASRATQDFLRETAAKGDATAAKVALNSAQDQRRAFPGQTCEPKRLASIATHGFLNSSNITGFMR